MNKHAISLILAIFMLITLVSCGGEKEPPETKSDFWRAEEIELPRLHKFSRGDIFTSDGDFLIAGHFGLDPDHPEIESHDVLLRVDAKTGESTLETPESFGDTLERATLSDGSLCVVAGKLTDDQYEDLKLTRTDKNGKVLAEYDIDELFGVDTSKLRFDIAMGSGGFCVRLMETAGDALYVVSNIGAVRIGETISRIDSKRTIISASLDSATGELVVFTEGNDGILTADFASGSFEKLTIPDEFKGTTIYPFAFGDSLFGGVASGRIYAFDRDGDKLSAKPVFDLADAGIAGYAEGAASIKTDEGTIFCLAIHNEMENETKYFRMIPSEAKEKQVLKLAFVGRVNPSEYYAIAEFNRTHDDVRIDAVYYNETITSDGMTDRNAAVEKFERDMVAGNLPDIVLLPGSADAAGYAGKGLFRNLYDFMDDSFRSDLSPFVKEFETDFKSERGLYFLPLNNRISTLVGRASEFPDGLSLDIFLDRLENPKDGQNLRAMFFSNIVYESIDCFVDPVSGKTNFDSDLFRRLADNYKKYGNKRIEGGSSKDIGDGKLLLASTQLTLQNLVMLKVQDGIDDLKILGYPGGAPEIDPGRYLGITKDCKNTDAAADYLRIRTSERYLLKNQDPYLTKSGFESYLESQSRFYYFSATGSNYLSSKDALTGKYYDSLEKQLGANFLEYELDDDLIKTLRDTLEIAKPKNPISQKIADIAVEELDTLRSRSSRTVEETIKIIGDRAANLINEKK